MAPFDDCIRDLRTCVDSLRQRAPHAAKELHHPGAPGHLVEGLPIHFGADSNPGVLLRSDTFLELGNPAAGSCAAAMWADDPSLVVDGRLTVVGPAIPDVGDIADLAGADGSASRSLPFAQVLLAAGPDLCEEDH